jgi:hypothetical protein
VRARLTLLLATFVAVVAASSSACSGGGGGGGDDDSPTPSPTFEADRCQIVWRNDVTTSVKDVYLVDASVGTWVLNTAMQFAVTDTGFSGVFYRGLDLNTATWALQAITTTGTFSLLTSGTETGQILGFDDVEAQSLWSVSSGGDPVAVIGTGAAGSFSGFWSDPFSQNVTPGSGTVTLAIDGTAHTLGIDLSYAVCYTDEQSFPSGGAFPSPPLPRREIK